MSEQTPTPAQPSSEEETIESQTQSDDAAEERDEEVAEDKTKGGFDEAAESEMMRRLRDLGYVE